METAERPRLNKAEQTAQLLFMRGTALWILGLTGANLDGSDSIVEAEKMPAGAAGVQGRRYDFDQAVLMARRLPLVRCALWRTSVWVLE